MQFNDSRRKDEIQIVFGYLEYQRGKQEQIGHSKQILEVGQKWLWSGWKLFESNAQIDVSFS